MQKIPDSWKTVSGNVDNLDLGDEVKNIEQKLTELVDEKSEDALTTFADKLEKTFTGVICRTNDSTESH